MSVPELTPALERFLARTDVPTPYVVVDVDVSYRPLGSRLHLGVRRSPLPGMLQGSVVGELKFQGDRLPRRRTADKLDADHRAPYTCSARLTKESTSVLATLSNTGLTTSSSARFENA